MSNNLHSENQVNFGRIDGLMRLILSDPDPQVRQMFMQRLHT
jgi:hypothetical protein